MTDRRLYVTSPGAQEGVRPEDTPPELVFPPQYPFSWTLRGARARRLRAKTAPAITRYRVTGSTRDANELAAVAAFCEAHNAKLERISALVSDED
jgi:hypothetical protein